MRHIVSFNPTNNNVNNNNVDNDDVNKTIEMVLSILLTTFRFPFCPETPTPIFI